MAAIEAHNLSKTYTSVKKEPGIIGGVKALFSRQSVKIEAVKDVNLSIEQGEVVGFLGPNGAGKTTTIKMLAGILHPTSGEAQVLGYRPFDRRHEMLRNISLVMGNKNQLWWDLPAIESFRVMKELYNVDDKQFESRLDYLVETLQINDKLSTQVRRLSLGERMKCELVAALLHEPKVLFLDEPTIGLDVVSQKRIRDFLLELNKRDNCTIILTSHYMQDVQETCDRVVIIDHGSIIYDGKLLALTERYSKTRNVRLTLSQPINVRDFEPYGSITEQQDNVVVISVPREQTSSTTGMLLQKFPVSDISIEEISVDEVIRNLFSHSSRS